MFAGIPIAHESHLLECRSVSFVRTVHRGAWCSRLYTPPIVAQFLRDVSLETSAGEIAAVCGVTGAGKSTLLNVIANRARGSVGGTVLLDRQLLTAARFRKLCSFVDVRSRLLPFLTVRETVSYQLRLALSGRLTTAQIEDRLLSQLNEWELLGYSHERVGDISESSRRRLLLAIATAKDPIVLVADDPLRNLEPLSAYQLMLCLQSFVRRHRRMAIISMRTPRSDIAQLLDKITLLYYGEPVYSGETSKLPLYLHRLGFLCPPTENPAAYFVSLVTLDRETGERFVETQEQAVKLIEAFRNCSPSFLNGRPSGEPIGFVSGVALCNAGRPGLLGQLSILLGRTINCTLLRMRPICWNLLAFPLFVAYFGLFAASTKTKGTKAMPRSMGQQMGVLTWAITVLASIVTIIGFSPIRRLLYQEAEERLYPSLAVPMIYLSVTLIPQMIGLFGGTALFFWLIEISSLSIIFESLSIFLGCYLVGQLSTLILMLFIRRAYPILMTVIFGSAFYWVFGGGTLRSYSTLSTLPTWAAYLTWLSPYRYANRALIELTLNHTTITDCRRNERQDVDNTPVQQFCRWVKPLDWLDESYQADYFPKGYRQNLLCLFAFTVALLILVLFFYFSPKLRPSPAKFKYK